MEKISVIVIEEQKMGINLKEYKKIDPLWTCVWQAIPWNRINEFDLAILNYAYEQSIIKLTDVILQLKCKNTDLLIAVVNDNIPAQEQIILYKAGVDTFITEPKNKEELYKCLEELENIMWYRNWKKEHKS